MSRSRRLMSGAIVLMVLLIFTAGGLFRLRTASTLEALRTLAGQATQVSDLGETLLLGLLDAEANARAFKLTGRADYLVPYTTARVTVAASLSDLAAATRPFPSLAADMRAIEGVATARLALLAEGLRAAGTGTPEPGGARRFGDAVRATTNEARTLIERLIQHATEESEIQSNEAQASARVIRIGVSLAAIAGVLLLATAALALVAGRDKLFRTQAELQAQSALWQGTVENLQDGVAVFDAAGGLVQWNRSLAPLTGFSAALLQPGTPFSRFVQAAAHWQPPALAAAAGSAAAEVRAGGRVLEIWRNAMPGGGHMLTVGDITRRVEAEAVALQAQKMDVLGQLTGGVAHDFNNLLQVISANLQLMSDRVASGNPMPAGWMHSRLTAAMEGVDRGSRLTRHLLAFARRQPLLPEAVDAARLLAGLEDMLHRALGPTVAVDLVVPGHLWPLRADAQQLENAILNLAINGRDAMAALPPERARLTIEAANAALDSLYCAANPEVATGDYVMFAVTDIGCGMTAEQIGRAVEPFYTTKPEGYGTGLGLSMVYGFAKQSGGHLKLYSEPGQGTTVRLYIPRSAAPVEQRAAPAARLQAGRGETILLVEDDPAVRSATAMALQGLGYRIEPASDADAALTKIEGGLRPHLLFTDVMMPGALSAREMADRAQALLPGLAVVFTSGYTENSIVRNGRLDPDVHLISKPWRLEDLASRLRAALDRGQAHSDRLCILLVEDDELVRLVTADMLADLGHEVLEAASAEAALALVDRAGLLMTDVGLADMDGLALAAAARAQSPGLPVVVASGQPEPPGGDGGLVWLCKPYDQAALCRALDDARAAGEFADRPSAMT
jgi:signal transduction histidine kinase/DNA-binding response OmpR family regulator